MHVIASGLGAATPFLEAKQAKAIAALSDKRPASWPDLPTIAEAGYSNFNLRSWMGIFVRAGTPKEITDKLELEVLAAIDSVDVKDRLQKLGLEPSPMKSQAFGLFIQGEIANWKMIVEATGAKIQ